METTPNQFSKPDGAPTGSQGSQAGSGIADDLKQQAGEITEQAKTMAREAAQSGQSLAADQLNEFADGVRRSADSWDDTQHVWVKQALTSAADGIERFSSTLKDRDLPSLLSEAEGAARRNPALFAAGCAVVGFALVRFLQSSSRRDRPYAGAGADSRRGSQSGRQPDAMAGASRYSDGPQSGYSSTI
jgi:hypothetical protein